VTTSQGGEGFTADDLEAFKRHDIERGLIAYDRDAAGDAAAEKLARQFTAERAAQGNSPGTDTPVAGGVNSSHFFGELQRGKPIPTGVHFLLSRPS